MRETNFTKTFYDKFFENYDKVERNYVIATVVCK